MRLMSAAVQRTSSWCCVLVVWFCLFVCFAHNTNTTQDATQDTHTHTYLYVVRLDGSGPSAVSSTAWRTISRIRNRMGSPLQSPISDVHLSLCLGIGIGFELDCRQRSLAASLMRLMSALQQTSLCLCLFFYLTCV